MADYQVAIIVTVSADTYHNALLEAECIQEDIEDICDCNAKAVVDYERDSDGKRVVRLHSEDKPLGSQSV